ncbi:transglutaminase family protein [Chryseolinea sp. T2]|uniref:transglutaminase family protein n=1 Tax=Chryseolinea sp. T2 TaxID=3129255 RepID=UPI003077B92A
MRYKITHVTEYKYQEPVGLCHNRVCLTPRNNSHQTCQVSDIRVVPSPDEFNYRTDFFGNTVAYFSSYKEHDTLQVTSVSHVNLSGRQETDLAFSSSVLWHDVSALIIADGVLASDVFQYTLPSQYIPHSEAVREFAKSCFQEDATLWSACNVLMQKIYKSIEFKPGFTTINTPVEHVIRDKKGVCQDFAHLMISCLRNMGLPARYVSGYIETVPPPGKEKLVGTDASHAWVSVYFPTIGWVEFDPTNCLHPTFHHITVAYGRDYHDVAPLRGIVFGSGKQSLTVKVDVVRSAE